MQRILIIFCHNQQFHLSHVTVADPDSSYSNRLYPNEFTDTSVTRQSNSTTTKFLLSAPKEVFTSRGAVLIRIMMDIIGEPCVCRIEPPGFISYWFS